MLRGFRWQLIFLVVAIVLLGAAIILQPEPMLDTSPAAPTATMPPAPQVSAPTPLPPQEVETPLLFREGVVGSVQRLNPLFADLNPVDRDLTHLIFEGLVTTNQYGEYIPLLASEWIIASNQVEYVFRLREDVLWQDGVPFTSADVAATVALLQAPDNPLPEDLTRFWQTVELELLDEYTVRFRLAQPLAAFLDYMRVGILPAHVFSGLAASQLINHPFNLSPIGTGPYQIEHITGSEQGITSVSLRVAPVYRQRPEGQSGYKIERLIFRFFDTRDAATAALRAGEIDGLGSIENDNLTDLEQASAINTHIALAPTIGMVLFNWESEHTLAFRDLRTRQALIVGSDRSGIVNRNLSGLAILADSPVVPGSWAYRGPISWPAYDPAGALELLSEITFARPAPDPTATPEDFTPEPTTEAEPDATETPTPVPPTHDFSLLTSNNPMHITLANELVAQWTQLGLEIRIDTVSTEELFARLDSGDFDAALAELTLSPRVDPDPYVFWHQGQYPDGQNYGGVNDRRTSELLEAARRDPNGLHRAEHYAEFQQVFVSRALAILLYYPVYEYGVSTRFEGIALGYLSTPSDRFLSIANWSAAD